MITVVCPHLVAVDAAWDDGPDPGRWIADRLGPFGPSVGHAVPLGYAAHAVVPIPADEDDFRDLYCPNSRRHTFEAIVAYGAYKRSPDAGAQPTSEAAHLKGGPISTEGASLGAWRDKGGASH